MTPLLIWLAVLSSVALFSYALALYMDSHRRHAWTVYYAMFGFAALAAALAPIIAVGLHVVQMTP